MKLPEHGDEQQSAAVMLMQREPVVRVLLGDADPLAGQAVTALLSAEANVAVIGCESGALGLTRAAEKCSPSVLVVDVGQQPFSGRGLLGQWVTLCPHIVALTTGLTPADAVELLRAGVRGLNDKADVSLLPMAVRAAATGQVLVAPSVSTPMVDQWRSVETPLPPAVGAPAVDPVTVSPGGLLTRQERAVLVLVASGHSGEETARRLCVSASTVQGHMHRVLGKLKLKDRTQAVAWAYLSGLCPVAGQPIVSR